MSESTERVRAAAAALGFDIDILAMPASTRTAEDAAQACGCSVDRIVKSMIFEREDTGALLLMLVSGRHQADLSLVGQTLGTGLKRADPKRVRAETGFAIGGVAPIGHLTPLECWMDSVLTEFDSVWAAAGTPNAVFEIAPSALAGTDGVRVIAMTAAP